MIVFKAKLVSMRMNLIKRFLIFLEVEKVILWNLPVLKEI